MKHGEPDGVYEAIGEAAGDWFELWKVDIENGLLVGCTRYPDGTHSVEEPYTQLPRGTPPTHRDPYVPPGFVDRNR